MMNPTIFRDPEGTEEMKRLRDIVERGLGQEPYEVTGIKAGPDGDLLLTLTPKEVSAD
jgi:hypothetical protein